MCKSNKFIGDFAIHVYIHTEEKPSTCKVGMCEIYAYIYLIVLTILFEIYVFDLFISLSNRKDMPYFIHVGFAKYFLLFYLFISVSNRKDMPYFIHVGFAKYFATCLSLKARGSPSLCLTFLLFYFSITKYMEIILQREEIYVFDSFPSVSNRKEIPYFIQVGFAKYGYVHFISFHLICQMKHQKRIKINSFLLNNYRILICFLVRLFLISVIRILLILADFNFHRFLIPFGNFKIYQYFLSFYFTFNKDMVINILRKAEIFPNFTNYVQYKCDNDYKTSLHTG